MSLFWQKKKSENRGSKNPYIFIGLGNPGEKYAKTRHNSGFLALDYFAQKYGVKMKKIKCKAIVGEKTIAGQEVIFAKPQTYMNNSGESVKELVGSYKARPENVFVIYDDVDFETGIIKIRKKGSAGTHNGMRSIIAHIKSEDFPRIRIGIGKPEGKMDLSDYVLGVFNDKEQKLIYNTLGDISTIIEMIIKDGIESTMNRYNKKDD